jgi:hypothetical protein
MKKARGGGGETSDDRHGFGFRIVGFSEQVMITRGVIYHITLAEANGPAIRSFRG